MEQNMRNPFAWPIRPVDHESHRHTRALPVSLELHFDPADECRNALTNSEHFRSSFLQSRIWKAFKLDRHVRALNVKNNELGWIMQACWKDDCQLIRIGELYVDR